ncbi:Adenylate cyclase 2 [Thalassocella blandensis]|nr:Adenylate cyclase 2 [Thalassocella blandensis]
MNASTRLMLVDDNDLARSSLAEALQTEFEILALANGDVALTKIHEWLPDVVLTDVEMPGRNGYELCDAIKRNEATQHIPVIFFSHQDSIRERMVGYEMGGDDYLKKDCDLAELKFKLNLSAKRSRQSRELKASYESAQSTALEALSTSFELGKAVRYIEQSYACSEFEELGKMLARFALDINLSAVVMFVSRTGLLFFTSSGKDTAPLEAQLMEKLHSRDRFVDFGCRTLVNYPQVAILIKNMPLDDRERYGRIKDTLPFVMGATDAKVRMLDAEKALSLQCNELTSSIEAIEMTLETIKNNYQHEVSGISTIMAELRATIAMDIHKLDITLEDETHIVELIESTGRKIDLFLQENSSTEDILNNIVELLQRLTKEQNRIIVDTLASSKVEDETIMGDVELF